MMKELSGREAETESKTRKPKRTASQTQKEKDHEKATFDDRRHR